MEGDTAALVVEDIPAVQVKATVTPKLNLALHQNAVPFIRELSIVNEREEPLRDVVLTLTSEPAFLTTRAWKLEEVGASQTYRLTDLDVDLDGALLATLTEAQGARAVFSLTAGGAEIARTQVPIELLARNQWGGIGHMPDLVAAFVQPNDPAVDRILKKAAEILREHGKSPALDGYSQGPKHAWELASAVWAAVAALGLDYALPPASFEVAGQKVRSPGQIVDAGLATCMETTLLLCAALEQCGLNPLIVFTRGHAFAGVWLKDEQFSTVLVDDVTSLRKRVKLKELVLFETTLACQRPAPGFGHAAERGARQVSEAEEDQYELAVDLRRARLQRVRPLASETAAPVAKQVDESVDADLAPVFEDAPDLPDEAIIPQETEAPQGPTSRLDRWQRKLLDLSLRNSLLNFKATKRAIKLDAPDPGGLEDMLADGKTIRLRPRPDLMDGRDERSSTIHESRTREDVRRAHALDALARGEVLAELKQEDLDSRLVDLYRTARATLQEGGANTLFLALGFLSWTRDDKDDKRYRAPLILIPVTLHRKSVRSGFSLTLHDDEPRFNPTLLEMLRQDFKLAIPVVEGELPKDDSGLDVAGIWRAVGEAVKDVRGWEVTEDVVLATFSFAKYLMWKDLVDRTDHLKQNPVVRHLIETPRDPYPSDLRFPDPRTLDAAHAPQQTFCPLPADSSQLSAVMAAAKGKDFVLVGPPGTGKSQTIANLIAQCLAEQKTVLFVSEKIAALDVVYRRLRDVGLGEFCLELHSSKARKLDVLEQLKTSWNAKGSVDAAKWKAEADRLKHLRDGLNTYVEHLHKRYRNGLTPYGALGRVIANREMPAVGLSWPSLDAHDTEALQALRDLAERLDIDAREVGGVADTPLALIAHGEWSPTWQQSLLDAAQAVIPAAQKVTEAADAFRSAAGLPDLTLTRRVRDALAALSDVLPEASGRDWRFVLRPDMRTLAELLLKGLEILARHREITGNLSCPYGDRALHADLGSLRSTWREADSTWFLKAWLMRRSVRKELTALATGASPADPWGDIERLLELRALEEKLAHLAPLAGQTSGLWAGLHTQPTDVERALRFHKQISAAIAGLSDTADTLSAVKGAVERLLGDANAMLDPAGPLAGAGGAYKEALARFDERAAAFAALAGMEAETLETGTTATPAALAETCRAILPLQPKLHAWCAWRKARAEAISAGLGPLVTALEDGTVAQGTLPDVFETAYCRWWINAVVDADDVLRRFVSAEHEKRIADFRALDERFTDLTRNYLRAGLCSALPDQDNVGKSSEWGILRREMEKKRRHLPLRELVGRLPTALTKLAPCLLMSPLSIAQYLSAETAPFDVVVFDEASQIPVWDAVGAIARGKQVVMVGDPKQLPPTNFFGRGESDADEDDIEIEGDLESILDECLGANLPTLDLAWHYRSRHESLIAFSNHRYYGGGLVTFPSPVTEDRAVSFHWVENGVYEKGGSRINQPEARALVADVVARLKDPAFKASGLTIGVVTFNSEQQRLIEDLLDEERRKDPSIEPHFSEDALEPVFVKNLESVQGDERDVMYFSITYGPDRTGNVSMNFGPMNKDGGERRLNVAVTRARHELRVFSTLRPEQIDLSRTQAAGVRDLKHFLEFAERGPRALAEAVFGSIGDYDSPFEKAVAEALRRKGWQVHPQVGVSSFRIDLGVVDPDAPGQYLAGVECDGATYHRSATARDRDKLREQVLRGLGWEILRIWSTDWWHDAGGALEKIHARLEEQLRQARARRAAEAEEREREAEALATAEAVAQEEMAAAEDGAGAPSTETGSDAEPEAVAGAEAEAADAAPAPMYARNAAAVNAAMDGSGLFREADPADAASGINADAFHEPHYDTTLTAMIAHVVDIEGPVREDVLAKRIARAHGWARTGARIRDRVIEVAAQAHPTTTEDVGTFYWPKNAGPSTPYPFRRPLDGTVRSIDEIALQELASLARDLQAQGLTEEEGLTAMAREAGLQQLRKAARERLEAAWKRAWS
jgi:very-short-patch-repair endonuclease